MEIVNGEEIRSIWTEMYWRKGLYWLCSVMQRV